MKMYKEIFLEFSNASIWSRDTWKMRLRFYMLDLVAYMKLNSKHSTGNLGKRPFVDYPSLRNLKYVNMESISVILYSYCLSRQGCSPP